MTDKLAEQVQALVDIARDISTWQERADDLDDDLEYLNSGGGWSDMQAIADRARAALSTIDLPAIIAALEGRQDIASAPKDGTNILAVIKGNHHHSAGIRRLQDRINQLEQSAWAYTSDSDAGKQEIARKAAEKRWKTERGE